MLHPNAYDQNYVASKAALLSYLQYFVFPKRHHSMHVKRFVEKFILLLLCARRMVYMYVEMKRGIKIKV